MPTEGATAACWTVVRRVHYTDNTRSSMAYLYVSRDTPGQYAVSEYSPGARRDLAPHVWDASFCPVTPRQLLEGIASTRSGSTVRLNTPSETATLSQQELHGWSPYQRPSRDIDDLY